jgi:hypothetical protein
MQTLFSTSMFALTIMLTLSFSPSEARLYKWKDTAGNTHYSDLPPTEPTRGSAELDSQGMVRSTKEATALTPAELKAKADAKAAAIAATAAAALQKRIDSALLSSYHDGSDINNARDEAITNEKMTIRNALDQQKSTNAQLDELQEEIKPFVQTRKAVPSSLSKKITAKRNRLKQLSETIADSEAEIIRITKQAESDKARLLILQAK